MFANWTTWKWSTTIMAWGRPVRTAARQLADVSMATFHRIEPEARPTRRHGWAIWGGYQMMTTLAKKVGGPAALAVVTAVSGWAIVRGAEAGGKGIFKAAKAAAKKRNGPCPTKGQVFDVVSDGEDGKGLALRAGDQYRVMECDGEAILIEVLGGTNNPYVTSAQFLASVSGFPTTEETKAE
ncbi:hypothetical protein ACFWFU_12680 [Streptomyces sp. NPDC060235]|uniref:hypothetical protein n=1 Tax=Streptomyces sp. NPDC060235 TaxID=3347080 RepID=UPI00365E3350